MTERGRRVLHLIAQGSSTKQIAVALGISDHAVKWHVGRLFREFGVQDRPALVAEAFRRQVLRSP